MELKGCIAPVSKLTSWGTGIASKIAMQRVMHAYDALIAANKGKAVILHVKAYKG
jgi:hypothetical protein